MGGGSWSSDAYDTIKSTTQRQTTQQIFRNSKLDPLMDPKLIKFRESRDSVDHPLSLAIMFLLDQTGSMGHIPKHLVQHKLGSLMTTVLDHGTKDAHLLFGAIGDMRNNEESPLQIGEFEAETTKLNGWLTRIHLESNGGGNGGESYAPAWLFAARSTSIDCFEKRQQKGFLFTVGDELTHQLIPASDQKKYMGYAEASDITAAQALEEARRMYHVYHINLNRSIQSEWTDLMGENALYLDDADSVAEVVATTIAVVQGANLAKIVSTFDWKTAGDVTLALANVSQSLTKTSQGVITL